VYAVQVHVSTQINMYTSKYLSEILRLQQYVPIHQNIGDSQQFRAQGLFTVQGPGSKQDARGSTLQENTPEIHTRQEQAAMKQRG